MTQTVVEWFIDNAFDEGFLWVTDKPAMFELNLIIEKAKEMDKEQKKYFFDCGRQYQLTGEGTFTQVYDETYQTQTT